MWDRSNELPPPLPLLLLLEGAASRRDKGQLLSSRLLGCCCHLGVMYPSVIASSLERFRAVPLLEAATAAARISSPTPNSPLPACGKPSEILLRILTPSSLLGCLSSDPPSARGPSEPLVCLLNGVSPPVSSGDSCWWLSSRKPPPAADASVAVDKSKLSSGGQER